MFAVKIKKAVANKRTHIQQGERREERGVRQTLGEIKKMLMIN